MARRIPLLVLFVSIAGCIQGPADGEEAAATLPSAEPVEQILKWNGWIRAGFVQDIPGHMAALSDVGRPLWNMSFYLDVTEIPELLEVEVAWTARAARMMLMVIEPEKPGTAARIHENPTAADGQYTDRTPICMRIPVEALKPGMWSVMVHSGVAVDADLRFEVRSTGGSLQIDDHAHVFQPAEFVEVVRNNVVLAPEPCGKD